ncbi:MAG: hypothetical protein MUE46_08025 [Xanthomonadales bacterium]|jgi:hypothetical protein|nr:hypothetical protein [Xanthomonadales bacterium]
MDTPKPDPDADCLELLAHEHAEVRDWLRRKRKSTLGVIQTHAESRSFIDALYKLGVPQVFAVEIDKYPGGMENTGKLVIELPVDPAARASVFDWAAVIAQELGFDGKSDVGQKYLFVMLD